MSNIDNNGTTPNTISSLSPSITSSSSSTSLSDCSIDFDLEFGNEYSHIKHYIKRKVAKASSTLCLSEKSNDIYVHVYVKSFDETLADRLSARGGGTPRIIDDGFESINDGVSIKGNSSSINDVGGISFQDPIIRILWNESIEVSELNQDMILQFRSLYRQLGVDAISPSVLHRFNVRVHLDNYDQPAILYPRYRGPTNRSRPPIGMKIIRRLADGKLEKENFPETDIDGKRKFSGIFGYHLVSQSDRTICITTNERDALAVYDATGGMLVISLPQGEKMDYSILPYLEDFENIYIWFPKNHQGFAKDYAVTLNASRCYVVLAPERPIELIRDGKNKEIEYAIRDVSLRVRSRAFKSLVDIRDEVKAEVYNNNTSKMSGFGKWKRFDILNNYLGGLRPGEITLLTGGSGYGKTTFLSEYSLDLFTQGVRTLFCSFDVIEEKIAKWMLIQYVSPAHIRSLARTKTYHNGVKLPLYRVEHHPSVELWLDKFEKKQTDFIFLKGDDFRNKTISEIYNILEKNIVQYGIQHIVVDNIQFLVGLCALANEKITPMERNSLQDRFVSLLRNLATDYGVHVTIVLSPRRTTGDYSIDLQDINSSGKITQEADNILVISRRQNDEDSKRAKKYFIILKNRFGGKRTAEQQIEMIYQLATYTHILVDHSKSI
uniref:SF4 helicase domain-containing protein n=1 Tax=Strongyloides papillosus TaxID=174720 RepID=A0A0N5C1J8_STREA